MTPKGRASSTSSSSTMVAIRSEVFWHQYEACHIWRNPFRFHCSVRPRDTEKSFRWANNGWNKTQYFSCKATAKTLSPLLPIFCSTYIVFFYPSRTGISRVQSSRTIVTAIYFHFHCSLFKCSKGSPSTSFPNASFFELVTSGSGMRSHSATRS